VENLKVDFASVDDRVHVLNGVSFNVNRGEIVGIVGESGSGKTTLGLAILRLLDSPPAEIVGGSMIFEEKDLLKLDPKELSLVRGTGMNMVFQESLIALIVAASINPLRSMCLRLARLTGTPLAFADFTCVDHRTSSIDERVTSVTIPKSSSARTPAGRIRCCTPDRNAEKFKKEANPTRIFR
jgi:ABC-type dipeptide/oligopeptide/nickel transport system ATPase component